MHPLTDYIMAAVFIYLFCKGWLNGFIKTLIGPASFVLGCIVGYIYFKNTQNLFAGLSICAFGPLAISILLSLAYKLWHKNAEEKQKPSLLSRSFASGFSLLWGGAYLVIMMILISIAPFEAPWFKNIQDDVLSSKSYALVDKRFGHKVSNSVLDFKKLAQILRNPEKLEMLESTEELQAIREDPTLKELLSDEELAAQIKNKDYASLITNPKIQAIMSDQKLLEKLFAFNKRVMEESLNAEIGEETFEDLPKVMEVVPEDPVPDPGL